MSTVEVLHIHGDVEDADVYELIELFRDLAAENRFRVVVNLSRVETISAAAMGFLIRAARIHRCRNGNVVVSAPSKAVRDLARRHPVEEKIRFFATDLEAVSYLDGMDGSAVPAGALPPRPSLNAYAVPARER